MGMSFHICTWTSDPCKSMETYILHCPWKIYASKKAYEYARKVLKAPWPKGERKILKSPYYSYLYARHVLKAPWPKGEKVIAKNAESSYLYAKYVLKRRFILGEINKSDGSFCRSEKYRSYKNKYYYLYAKYVIKGRWKKMENKMAKDGHDPRKLAIYAVEILKGRWKRAEPHIAKNSKETIEKYVTILKPEEYEDFRNLLLMEALVDKPYWQGNGAKDYLASLKTKESK